MGRIFHKTAQYLLLTLFALALLPAIAFADATGTCGTCTYTITGSILTIEPTDGISGTLESYKDKYSGHPGWDSTSCNITTLQIKPGVGTGKYVYGLFNSDSLRSSLRKIEGIEYLDTSNTVSMAEMFRGDRSLISLDLSSWDTSNVTDVSNMFYGCFALKSLNLSNWNTAKVTNTSNMFGWCKILTSLELGNLDTSNVTDMSYMFSGCDSVPSLDLSDWDTSNVTNMQGLFGGDTANGYGACKELRYLDLKGWNTSNVTNMAHMFSGCSSLTHLDLSSFDTSSVTNMSNMFGTAPYGDNPYPSWNCEYSSCSSLTSLDLSSWNTSNVTNMEYMLSGCSSLITLDLAGLDTSNVTTMHGMFYGCKSLRSLNLSGFDTSNVTEMEYMFGKCQSLQNLDLTGFNTTFVSRMGYLFYKCSALNTLDLSSFDNSNAGRLLYMFSGCSSLRNVKVGENYTFSNESSYYGQGYLPAPSLPDGCIGKWENTATSAIYSDPSKIPNYTAATYTAVFDLKTATIANASLTYNGKLKTPATTVKNTAGTVLKQEVDYTVSYSNNRDIGKAKVKVTGKGIYRGTLSGTFKIVPGKTKVSSLKSKAKKKAVVKYKKVSGGVKYQIAYKAGSGKWKYTTSSKTSKTITKLTSKKKVTVKVRAYKKVSGKTYYGAWSKTKSVKVK